MGQINQPVPVMLLLALFSRHEGALDWARQRGIQTWGPLALASEVFAFEETDYYTASMGEGLKKQFFVFEKFIDPARLPEIKHQTNQWELDYKDSQNWPEQRPLNLDPGYLTEAKLVLASTKDHHHRLYLSQGIFAECTLHYQSKKWQSRPWTYPDYQRADFQEFFTRCREYLRERIRSGQAR